MFNTEYLPDLSIFFITALKIGPHCLVNIVRFGAIAGHRKMLHTVHIIDRQAGVQIALINNQKTTTFFLQCTAFSRNPVRSITAINRPRTLAMPFIQ